VDNEINDIKKIIIDEDKLRRIITCCCNKEVVWRHKSKPELCPHCENRYWDKPYTEFKLFTLQEKYLKTRDQKILGEMYKILKLYAKKLIVTMVKGKFYYKAEELEIKAHESACKLIFYYLEKPTFCIESSFGGYLNWPIRNVLYADKNEEGNDSLNCLIDNEKELDEFLPGLSEVARKKMIVNFEENLIDKHSQIVDRLYKIVYKISNKINKEYGISESLLFLVGLRNKIKGLSDNFMDSFYLYTGLETQKNIDKALFIIYKALKRYSIEN
jgi:hypothetical protein